jgi:hypothetical protein
MAETVKPQSEHEKAGHRKKTDRKFVVKVMLVIIGLYLVLIAVAVWHPHLNERVKFATENGLSLAILIAVIAQVIIYREQWRVMQRQAKSADESVVFGLRAHVGVHGVSSINFNERRFVIEIGNSGEVPATRIDLKYIIEVRVPERWADDAIRQVPWKQAGNLDWILQWGDSRYYGRAPLSRDLKIKKPINLSAISEHCMFEIWQGHAQIALKGNVEFNDGFNSGKNAPFAFYYSHEDKEWIVDAVITKEEVEALLAERARQSFGDRDPLSDMKIINVRQPPLKQAKAEKKNGENKGKPN